MIEAMRKNLKSLQIFLWLVIVAFIGTIFFVWGQGGRQGRAGVDNAAAWVNGSPISLASYEQEYRNIYDMYRQLYGDKLTKDVAKNLQLEQVAINQVIQRTLLVTEAQRYGLRVSDAELVKAVREIPQFQRDNQFDPVTYKAVLARAGFTPESFEVQTLDNLLIGKIGYLVRQSARVTDAEAFEDYKMENEKVRIDGILVKPEQFEKNVTLADADVTAYYEAHKEALKTPERVKVQYLYFDPQRIKDEVTPTEEEIKQYYDNNEKDFNKGKEVKARHILFRLAKDANAETEAPVKQKAADVLQQLKNGADFAELAKQYSEDTGSGKNGGDVGFFAKGLMVPEFEAAAFALKVGEISELVRTQFGFHILKVEEIREEADPFGKAKPVIAERLKLEGAKDLAAKRAEDNYQKLLDKQDFAQAAKEANLEVRVSQLFAKGEPIDQTTPASTELQEVAFTLTANEKFSQPVETPAGYYLLEFLESKPPYIPELKEVTDKVTEAVRKEKAGELAQAEAEKIAADLKNGVTWEDMLKKYATAEKFAPEPFSRRQWYISEVKGDSAELVKTAFALKNEEHSAVINLSPNYCIIRIVEKVGIDEKKFGEEQEKVKQQLLRQKQETGFREFVEDLRQKADIKLSQLVKS